MERLMSSRYHLAVPGNHEITQRPGHGAKLWLDGHAARNNGVDFTQRYPMPFRQSGSSSPYMFSYESGLVWLDSVDRSSVALRYVIGLPGSYADTSRTSPQWQFCAEKLAEVDRGRTPWLVVMFHTPWYNRTSGDELCCQRLFFTRTPLSL